MPYIRLKGHLPRIVEPMARPAVPHGVPDDHTGSRYVPARERLPAGDLIVARAWRSHYLPGREEVIVGDDKVAAADREESVGVDGVDEGPRHRPRGKRLAH